MMDLLEERPPCRTCPHWGAFGKVLENLEDPDYPEGHQDIYMRFPPVFLNIQERHEGIEAAYLWSQPYVRGDHGCGEHPDFGAWVARVRANAEQEAPKR